MTTVPQGQQLLETLSILVHADSKVGKTTLGATSPPPILILDAEGGSKFLPIAKTVWDPTTQAPPAYDDSWVACIVTIRDWRTVEMTKQWLDTGQHPFRSIVVDSISEIQRRCRENLKGTEQMKIQDWGVLLSRMDNVIRGIRDLTLHPTRPVQVVVFIAETREKNGKWKPYMQGQIEVALPYWMDIVGFLFVHDTADENGQPLGKLRRMLISPHPQYEAGERVQGRLPEVIDAPNVTEMFLSVYPHLRQNGAPPS